MNESIVSVQNLSRRFRHKIALADISCEIVRGRVLSLLGENGAGKTTLIKHLLGLYAAQSGTVRVFGHDPVREPAATLSHLGYLSEDRDLPGWMRVEELLDYTRAFYPRWDARYAAELLREFDLPPRQKVRRLSRGMLARVGLLVAVAHRPDLLILDEPSSGLDPGARHDILTAIVRTIADEGRTVLFSSHLLHEVQRVADDVALLHQGRLVLHEPMEDLLSRYRLVTVRFPECRADPPLLTGLLWLSGSGSEWTCLCNNHGESVSDEIVKTSGATCIDDRSPSLEELFLAYTRSDDLRETTTAVK
jgi:ABC-2 type transport system ATP-binding protein